MSDRSPIPIRLEGAKDTIPDAEARLREYCGKEVYDGYDNFHSVDNDISMVDIEATKRLNSNIDRYDKNESSALLRRAAELSSLLSRIPNIDLHELDAPRWQDLQKDIMQLFQIMLKVPGIGLPKAVKILHLKRPKLFPILDSYVVELLTGNNPSSSSDDSLLAELGVKALGIAREDIITNKETFHRLKQSVEDLPIPLTIVRIYDILCWTHWKWDVLGQTGTVRYVRAKDGTYRQEKGVASETPLIKPAADGFDLSKLRDKGGNIGPKSHNKSGPNAVQITTLSEFSSYKKAKEGFIVVTDTANGDSIHRCWCKWLKDDYFYKKVIENGNKNGRYFWYDSYEDASSNFQLRECKTCM